MKRMIKVNLMVIILASLISCKDQYNGQIQTNLSSSYEPYSNLVSLNNKLLIIGQNIDRSDFRKYNSKILTSNPKNLEKWDGINGYIPGNIIAYCTIKDYGYFISQIYKNKYSLQGSESLLYRMHNETNEFDSIVNFGEKFIKSIHFESLNVGYVFARSNGKYFLERTETAGRTWEQIMELPGIIDKVYFKNHKLYFTSLSNDVKKSTIYCFDTKKEELEVFYDEEFIIDDFHIESENEYMILEVQEKESFIISKVKNEVKTELKRFDGFCKKLHVYKDFIGALTSEIDDGLGGIGGTKYSLNISLTKGQEWKNIQLSNNNYVKPYMFYRDRYFIYYSGDGNMVHIEF